MGGLERFLGLWTKPTQVITFVYARPWTTTSNSDGSLAADTSASCLSSSISPIHVQYFSSQGVGCWIPSWDDRFLFTVGALVRCKRAGDMTIMEQSTELFLHC